SRKVRPWSGTRESTTFPKSSGSGWAPRWCRCCWPPRCGASSFATDQSNPDPKESLVHYDVVTIGNYTKDTIISAAGTRYVDGGGYSYAAHAAQLKGLRIAAVTRL